MSKETQQTYLERAHDVRRRARIGAEVQREIVSSNILHGDVPLPNGPGSPMFALLRDQQRAATDRLAAEGNLTHASILMEEVYEALAELPTDGTSTENDAALRAELVQASAMCQKWIADIDRRRDDGAV